MVRPAILLPVVLLPCFSVAVSAQTVEQQLEAADPSELAAQARKDGDARRGAILFHQVHIGCVKCHSVDGSANALGPDLTKPDPETRHNDAHVVTSILHPSRKIRRGYETVTVVTTDGRTRTGLLVSRSPSEIVLRDPSQDGRRLVIPTEKTEDIVAGKASIMPDGIANQLGGRQQFLDLVRYVLEIRDGGPEAAARLQPPPGLIAFRLPEYEQHVDHAGLIRTLDHEAAKRGSAIYNRLCINCHGDLEKPGSLPTALRFAEGRFKNGSDPYSMYRTLTHGFGLMVPQTWMVPRQKYDVIHYIRETYIKPHNRSQYQPVTREYLAALPAGDTFGPEPVEYAPWSDMNYGPSMINTFEIGSDASNFAYKGIAVRLDSGPGGIAKGSKWTIFDHDTLRLAAAWTRRPDSNAAGFINWEGIHFDGRHGRHPRIVGELQFQNPTGPGWANPETDSFEDNQRVTGRDGRQYGPLPRQWAKYRGLHAIGDATIVDYTVADTRILERHEYLPLKTSDRKNVDVFVRQMSLAHRSRSLTALVATHPAKAEVRPVTPHAVAMAVSRKASPPTSGAAREFDGRSWVEISEADTLDMHARNFTIVARIRTKANGTIFCRTKPSGPWVPDGASLFVRGGRLVYDIGWVGAVTSRRRINDGRWHDVAMTWDKKTGRVQLYVDGKADTSGVLRPKRGLHEAVARIGFTSPNFPIPSFFTGDIAHVAFFRKSLNADEVSRIQGAEDAVTEGADHLWQPSVTVDGFLTDRAGNKLSAKWKHGTERGATAREDVLILAGIVGARDGFQLEQRGRRICLRVPTGSEQRNVAVWTASVDPELSDTRLQSIVADIEDRLQEKDLAAAVRRPPVRRWRETVVTVPSVGPENGPFAIDVLTIPKANPWLCRMRLTGHDFLDDGDRVAVCTWDGDVWMVSGLMSLSGPQPQLNWQRIASGLFQPLGLKVVAGDIYLTCRDQLVILRDRNHDGETDFYECFNNDHQVTEHFHEFAMGLQRDEAGRFYYAKSARHALKAVVPHHGTLLRVPSDGSRTDILATGFRAANGVCLNPDGTFIVTDQEGHWNPKNRINWVHEGGFYGNMFGYHNVTDESDEAMEQPLCWITNSFDRSPAELLWASDSTWGPLSGSLLNLSYGYGKVYVVPHEEVEGQMQGGMCEFPIPQFPTGIIRGRFHDHDHALYLCGMFAWASSQQAEEGGFYRLRFTGKPSWLPVGLNASKQQLRITFTEPLDRAAATDAANYHVKVWSLKRTANYGSKHYNEHPLKVSAATLSRDGTTVTLTIPDLAPTWCMEIRCRLKSPDGQSFERVIHNTIHHLR